MAAAVEVEFGSRPHKIPKLDEQAVVEPKRFRAWEPEKEEFAPQYLQFHCQFHRTQGFGIEWDKFDFVFDLCVPLNEAPLLDRIKTNEEVINDVTNLAIYKYNKDNKDKGTKLVLVEHVSANIRWVSYVVAYWVTFWARDVSSPCSESKLYQAKILKRGVSFQFPIFRLKPTHEEMMAVRVRTPLPIHYDIDKPPIVFRRAGPGEDPVPGTPFVFSRDGGEFVESEEEDNYEEWKSEDEDELKSDDEDDMKF